MNTERRIFSGVSQEVHNDWYPNKYLTPLQKVDFLEDTANHSITDWYHSDPLKRKPLSFMFEFNIKPGEFWHLTLPMDMYENIYGFFELKVGAREQEYKEGDHVNNVFTGTSLPTSFGNDYWCLKYKGIKYNSFCMSNHDEAELPVRMLVILTNDGYDGDGSETSPWGALVDILKDKEN